MKYLSSTKDLDANCKYIAIYDDSITYEEQGAYGDHRLDFQRILTFNSDKDLNEWIEKKAGEHFEKKYKILMIYHCDITTSIHVEVTIRKN